MYAYAQFWLWWEIWELNCAKEIWTSFCFGGGVGGSVSSVLYRCVGSLERFNAPHSGGGRRSGFYVMRVEVPGVEGWRSVRDAGGGGVFVVERGFAVEDGSRKGGGDEL